MSQVRYTPAVRFTANGLLLVAALAAAGCAAEDDPDADDSTPTPTATATPPEMPATIAVDPTNVTVSLPFGLDMDGKHYPPVIGGKNAISRAPATGESCFTCALSMAVRISGPFSKA